jgi:hypothetical protein
VKESRGDIEREALRAKESQQSARDRILSDLRELDTILARLRDEAEHLPPTDPARREAERRSGWWRQ